MKFKKNRKNTSEASMDSIQLVASLLICFPEMGKVTLDSKEEGIWLDFTLSQKPSEERMTKVNQLLTDSLRLYHDLEGIQGARMAFFYETRALHIFRDLDSLTKTEIDMLVTLVRENFADLLLTDGVRNLDEDAVEAQSEMIDYRIRFLRENHIGENMVGIREEGRVMVY